MLGSQWQYRLKGSKWAHIIDSWVRLKRSGESVHVEHQEYARCLHVLMHTCNELFFIRAPGTCKLVRQRVHNVNTYTSAQECQACFGRAKCTAHKP